MFPLKGHRRPLQNRGGSPRGGSSFSVGKFQLCTPLFTSSVPCSGSRMLLMDPPPEVVSMVAPPVV